MFHYDAWQEEVDYPMATEADAHREWHRNTGVPMGQPGCPQDACDGYPEDYDEQADYEQDLSERDPFRDDVEADADTLASAGWGTEEDYGYFGGDEW